LAQRDLIAAAIFLLAEADILRFGLASLATATLPPKDSSALMA